MPRTLYERIGAIQAPFSTGMSIAQRVQPSLHFKCERWIESDQIHFVCAGRPRYACQVKTDDPGFLDVKLVIVTTDPAPWLAAVAEVGSAEDIGDVGGWVQRRVLTTAVLRDLKIRVLALVGAPSADAVVAFVGADRIVSDGVTEIPEVSLATVARVVGPPERATLLGALKDVLREGASATS